MYEALVKSLSDAQSRKHPTFLRVGGIKCPFERTKCSGQLIPDSGLDRFSAHAGAT